MNRWTCASAYRDVEPVDQVEGVIAAHRWPDRTAWRRPAARSTAMTASDRAGAACGDGDRPRLRPRRAQCLEYHCADPEQDARPPRTATGENQAMLPCPCGRRSEGGQQRAERSAGIAADLEQRLCAKPCRPPDADAGDARGFRVEDRRADADQRRGDQQHRIAGRDATAAAGRPASAPMPTGSRNGRGRLSVKCPTTGCSSEAVSWNASVIMPIWPKSSANLFFRIG